MIGHYPHSSFVGMDISIGPFLSTIPKPFLNAPHVKCLYPQPQVAVDSIKCYHTYMKNKSTKVPKRVEDAIAKEVENKQQNDIQAAANEITAVLNKYGLGMQASIQIFKSQSTTQMAESPIVAMGHTDNPEIIIPGSENDPYKDVPPGIVDAIMRPTGDGFGK